MKHAITNPKRVDTTLMDNKGVPNNSYWKNERQDRIFARLDNKTVQMWKHSMSPSVDITVSVPYSYFAERCEWKEINKKEFNTSIELYLDKVNNLINLK